MPSHQHIDAFTLAFHREAVGRLQTQPELVEQAMDTLAGGLEQRGPPASDSYLKEWQTLLSGYLDALQAQVFADTGLAATLRSVSPLGIVLTPAERQTYVGRTSLAE
jgi:hypothetical protein